MAPFWCNLSTCRSFGIFFWTQTVYDGPQQISAEAPQKQGNRGAKIADLLLKRPDRLLGVILIGNNLANFTAASLATILAIEIFGEAGIALAPIICTVVFLILAEVAPKTIAAIFIYPEKIALPSFLVASIVVDWFSFCLDCQRYCKSIALLAWSRSHRTLKR